MKVYLAGKISGDPDYREKFYRAALSLEEKDPMYVVLNPSDLPEGMAPQDYMQLCTQMLFAADVVAFLPDWYMSPGACIEYQLCTYIGKPKMMLEGAETT